ncbi:MAG: putative sugar O-methyltransferase [Chlamydiota bacterium]
MNRILLSALLTISSQLLASESITEKDIPYRSMCGKAATDPTYFKNFRNITEYSHALEIQNGAPFANYLLTQGSPDVMAKLKKFKLLEHVGNPALIYYPFIGNFSATTLRYIAIADEISKRFELPENAKIVEVGAGFGGQCFILSQLFPFEKYYIYDLPETNALIGKVMETLAVPNVACMPLNLDLPEEKVDLFISNYAYSECDRAVQMDYLERLICKADRGYMIYNHVSHYYSVDSISHLEFVDLLQKNGIQAEVHGETIPTFESNYLVVWDKTKQ